VAADGIVVVTIDLEDPWTIGAVLIAVWVVISVATEVFVLNGNIREALVRGIVGGGAFAVVYLFLWWRYAKD